MIVFSLIALVIFVPSFSEGCGMRPAFSRVVNGQDASPHSWPWQISLRVNGRHICGGSLIRPDWILTAAHCVYRNPNPSGYTVVLGGHKRTGNTPVQQEFKVKALYKHSGFTMQNLKHDVAVLQLESPAQLSEKVNTICLPDQDADLGSQCYITGWGRISGGGPAADTLQQAKLPLVSHSDCKQKYGILDSSAHLCAGAGHSAAAGGCNGDSGGPLACEMGDKWYLHGAVSFGRRNCPTTYYTVFARITSYKSWILEKIGEDGGPNPPPPATPPPPGTPSPPVPPTQPGSCKDSSSRCKYLVSYCKSNQYVQKLCKKTCNTCDTNPQPTAGCNDSSSRCRYLASYCKTNKYVQQFCKKTCNTCGSGGSGGSGGCQDSSSRCPLLQAYCSNAYVKQRCRKTCKVC